MGFYLEWTLNEDWLLVIKSTAQADKGLREETEECKKHLLAEAEKQKVGGEVAYALKQYWIKTPFDDSDDEDPFATK